MPRPESITVKVNGRAWRKVDSLDNSTAKDAHYFLDSASGRIVFGDGVSGKRPPNGARIDVSYRVGAGAIAFQTDALGGIYRGIVRNNLDPLARMRLLVDVPDANATAKWAASCSPTESRAIPSLGDVVWISFEAGQIDSPVWLGLAVK